MLNWIFLYLCVFYFSFVNFFDAWFTFTCNHLSVTLLQIRDATANELPATDPDLLQLL